MKNTLMTTFGPAVLLQFLLISSATCQPVPQDRAAVLSDPRLIDQIVRATAPMNYSLVVDSRRISETKREDEVHWVNRRPVLGGMVIGMVSGFAVAFVRCVGHEDLTIAGAMIICGGYGAGIGAGIGAVVGKMISER
jgi:hypothetical protein